MAADDSKPEDSSVSFREAELQNARSVEYRGEDLYEDGTFLIGRDPKEGCYDIDIRVIELPMCFAVEFRISSPTNADFNISNRYLPREARELSAQINTGEYDTFDERFGRKQSEEIAAALLKAAEWAGVKALEE